jgi:DnaJ-class molecular chaperone
VRKGTTAQETSERIEPAVYRKDLYSVLGIKRSSTQKEIRDAYWAIAVISHPDRNNSQEALELFRNASYAYKILGKDKATRSNYDYTLGAEKFATALSEVGSDVVIPLARDVALPLINMTVRGIRSIAKAFGRDIYEQSKSVIDAVSSEEISNVEQISDLQQRVLDAWSKTRSEQQIRSITERIDITDRRISKSLEELESAVERKLSLTNLLPGLGERIKQDNETAINALRYTLQSKSTFRCSSFVKLYSSFKECFQPTKMSLSRPKSLLL